MNIQKPKQTDKELIYEILGLTESDILTLSYCWRDRGGFPRLTYAN